jgi:hypothetical protein
MMRQGRMESIDFVVVVDVDDDDDDDRLINV